MKMVPVNSSVIESIGYDRLSSRLTVVFRDGHVYDFHLVPAHVYEEFLRSASKGGFFNQQPKDGPLRTAQDSTELMNQRGPRGHQWGASWKH